MKTFLSRFGAVVTGVLCGFDRLFLRGTLRRIAYSRGLQEFLLVNHIRYKDFAAYSANVTARLEQASLRQAEQLKREVRYLNSSQFRKEDMPLYTTIRWWKASQWPETSAAPQSWLDKLNAVIKEKRWQESFAGAGALEIAVCRTTELVLFLKDREQAIKRLVPGFQRTTTCHPPALFQPGCHSH